MYFVWSGLLEGHIWTSQVQMISTNYIDIKLPAAGALSMIGQKNIQSKKGIMRAPYITEPLPLDASTKETMHNLFDVAPLEDILGIRAPGLQRWLILLSREQLLFLHVVFYVFHGLLPGLLIDFLRFVCIVQ